MLAGNPILEKAQRAAFAFGAIALVAAAASLGFVLVGGDDSMSVGSWVLQGVFSLGLGGTEIYLARRLLTDIPTAQRSLRGLSGLMYVCLAIGALSIIAGAYGAIVGILVSLMQLSYFRAAQRSLSSIT